jgi:hypothetical protein
MKKGYIVPNGVALETHENKTVVFLTELGFVVELIPPRPNDYRVKTPDAKINGKSWEIKAPRGNGKYTIDHILERAASQSPNVIIDLRRAKAPVRSLAQVRSGAEKRKKLRR